MERETVRGWGNAEGDEERYMEGNTKMKTQRNAGGRYQGKRPLVEFMPPRET